MSNEATPTDRDEPPSDRRGLWLIGLGMVAVTAMVAAGFRLQWEHRRHNPVGDDRFPRIALVEGQRVELSGAIVVADSKALCLEARRMRQIERDALGRKPASAAYADEWFRQMAERVRLADRLEVIAQEGNYTRVRDPAGGFEGYAFTLAIEDGLEQDDAEVGSAAGGAGVGETTDSSKGDGPDA